MGMSKGSESHRNPALQAPRRRPRIRCAVTDHRTLKVRTAMSCPCHAARSCRAHMKSVPIFRAARKSNGSTSLSTHHWRRSIPGSGLIRRHRPRYGRGHDTTIGAQVLKKPSCGSMTGGKNADFLRPKKTPYQLRSTSGTSPNLPGARAAEHPLPPSTTRMWIAPAPITSTSRLPLNRIFSPRGSPNAIKPIPAWQLHPGEQANVYVAHKNT